MFKLNKVFLSCHYVLQRFFTFSDKIFWNTTVIVTKVHCTGVFKSGFMDTKSIFFHLDAVAATIGPRHAKTCLSAYAESEGPD